MNILVTGVTSGFGKQIAIDLIAKGHTVIGTGRRHDKLTQLASELGKKFIPLAFDIADLTATQEALDRLPPDLLQNLDGLINNAGMALGLEKAPQADFTDWQAMINVNVTGLVNITRLLLPYLVARPTAIIINIGSIAGNYAYAGGNVYGATKAFVKQFSLNLRADLAGTNVRVSNVEPGLCGGTEFSNVRFKGDDEKASQVYENVQALTAQDISNVVTWIIEQPPHVNINRIEIMPTAQSFAGLSVARNQ